MDHNNNKEEKEEEVLKRTESTTGRNALHLAVIMDNFKVAEYLISCGINCNLLDNQGKRPIDYIVEKNSPMFALLYLSMNKCFTLGSSISTFSLEKLFALQE